MENTSTSLFKVKNVEKLNSNNFLSWQRSMVATLGIRSLESFLEETVIEKKEDSGIKRQCQTVYYFIIGHLDSENYDKFVVDEDKHPGRFWRTIKEHYASTSAENIATHFGKLFSIKFPSSSSGLSEAISSFCSTLKLLCSLSPQLFTGDIISQVLAFYVLRMLPEPCCHVSTAVFHSIKVSTKIPTVEEVFKEVELDIGCRVDTEEESNLALKVSTKPKQQLCSKGKHNPLAPHLEQECFQLFPEKRDAYHKRQTNHEIGMALGVCNLASNLPILDSGTSNTITPFKQLFVKTWASKEKLQAANGSKMCVMAEGTCQIKTSKGSLNIPNALLVPLATSTFIAMGPFLNEGVVLRGFSGGANLFCKEGKLLLQTRLVNNILVIDTKKLNPTNAVSSNDFLLLHKRLGHPGKEIASKMLPEYNLLEFPLPSDVLEVVHMDVCGPITPPTRGGNQMAETQIGVKIKTLVSDNGGELINKDFLKIFEKSGIINLPPAPYTPQQNPVAKRANQSPLEKIWVLLLNYQVPVEWWGEACAMATYLLNQTPVSSLGFQAPISKWNITAPSAGIKHLHPFGCTAIVNVQKERRTSKVSPSRILCMFLGNIEGHHNFWLYDPNSKRILISHNCTFKDGVSGITSDPEADVQMVDRRLDDSPTSSDLGTLGASVPIVENQDCSTQPSSPLEAGCAQPWASLEKVLPKGWEYGLVAETAPEDITSVISTKNIVSGKHTRQPPPRFAGAVVNTVPCSFVEAMASLKLGAWLNAMVKEFASLEQHQVIKDVWLEKGQQLLDTTWVFRENTDAEGNVTEEKARLCVRGFHQIEDVYFHETFAPTGRLATLRFLSGYCASNNFDVQQMDLKTAFLHGDLDKDIFIQIPEGYVPTIKGDVCLKLTKSLYGLKQSLRNWYLPIKRFIIGAVFCPSAADPCLFIKTHGDLCFVFLHVDDLVIGGLNPQAFKNEITSAFDMKDLGDLKYVLGMKVTRNSSIKTISLSQELYTNNLRDDFGMQDCKSVSTPLVPSSRLNPFSNKEANLASIVSLR
ncbi:hypothetical protein O181_027867, partial [Austropuccinia psidii MF-1]|nr:hypothetical protein [Austropuccinia psidii MF-1]